MIRIEHSGEAILELYPKGRLTSADLDELEKNIELLMVQHTHVKILVLAMGFSGWENGATAKKHFALVKKHHHKISKVAIIPGPFWQRCLIHVFKLLVHPKIKIFSQTEVSAAKAWLNEGAN